jgi:hypothetical protein
MGKKKWVCFKTWGATQDDGSSMLIIIFPIEVAFSFGEIPFKTHPKEIIETAYIRTCFHSLNNHLKTEISLAHNSVIPYVLFSAWKSTGRQGKKQTITHIIHRTIWPPAILDLHRGFSADD